MACYFIFSASARSADLSRSWDTCSETLSKHTAGSRARTIWRVLRSRNFLQDRLLLSWRCNRLASSGPHWSHPRRHRVCPAFIPDGCDCCCPLLPFCSLPWIQSMFYGIGAAIIAIIVRSAIKLVRTTVRSDVLLWIIFAALRSRPPGRYLRLSGCSFCAVLW